ncbi:MAG: hypothetical protein KKD77_23150 [Gammaproteobacteria bacterium]|nr:hypothetical protein [Gammaproteobacteria bacterium]
MTEKRKLSEYEIARNKLIRIAESYANGRNGKSCKGESEAVKDKWNNAWNKDFHGKMDKLARKLK